MKHLEIRRSIGELRWYWAGFALLWIAGLVSALSFQEGEEIFWFNHRRSGWWDNFFYLGNKLGEEPMFIGGFLLVLAYRFRSAVVWPFMLFTVSLVSHYTKTYFAHPRPSLFFREVGTFEQLRPLEGVFLNGGLTSFPSGHTMVAFTMFTFLALNWPSRHRGWQLFFLALATWVGLSRIYLIQHFLKDVLLGSAIGVLLALLGYLAQYAWGRREGGWWDRGLAHLARR